MPSLNDIREARAELQKMQADMADDKAFGMFSPALQKRITQTKKDLADLTVAVGKQRDAEKKLGQEQAKRAAQEAKIEAEAIRLRRANIFVSSALIATYLRLSHSVGRLRDAGMANTAEAERQHIAYTLLGREIAAVFLPATTASTNASMAAARAMTKLTQGGQDVIFVLSSATAGLVGFTIVQTLATAAGLKFTGVLASIARWLPLIGLAGGVLVGLGILFLNTESGASLLNKTLEETVDLMNKLAKEAEIFKNMNWTEWLGTKGFQLLEAVGILKKGVANMAINAVGEVQKREGRVNKPGDDKKREVTPAKYKFEGISDAWERVQIAAAKQSLLENDIPKAQLKALEAIEGGVIQLVKNAVVRVPEVKMKAVD